eukprot:GILJ01002741.1.p1 GENE.GILJ01002741.1~~GILJ01002741.1.p1  ORF type:complete len:183 (+),score=25.09 GILJ01002741.1:41-589(+)
MKYSSLAAFCWFIVGVEQLYVWNYSFPGDKNHVEFWTTRQSLLSTHGMSLVMKYVGASAILAAVLVATGKTKAIVASCLCSVFFIYGPLYHYWLPHFFGWGFWYNGAAYTPDKKVDQATAFKLFEDEFGQDSRILPRVAGHPIFVDAEHTLQMPFVLLGYIFAFLALMEASRKRPEKKLKSK